jgi:hypothetical protein
VAKDGRKQFAGLRWRERTTEILTHKRFRMTLQVRAEDLLRACVEKKRLGWMAGPL